jgi:carboxylesterase type B
MVWIYGGGFISGSNAGDAFNPTGILNAARANGGEPVIYAAINYRLGALGWLNAAGYDGDILANAGLHDQRLGLEWIQKYISRFGGDPDRVTVFGESAGGGSIMHHLTAYGGSGKKAKAPFRQAVMQSPGWTPTPNVPLGWAKMLAAASNVTGRSIADSKSLRSLSPAELLQANQAAIWDSPYGSFGYGPTVDGGYVPDMPGALLGQGRFDGRVRILVGHNSNETVPFTPPVGANLPIEAVLGAAAYGVSEANQAYILSQLYPPVSPSLDRDEFWYVTDFGRAVMISSEWSFTCNTRWLGVAFGRDGRDSYSYRFEVAPGWHGQDVGYTFWNGEGLKEAGVHPETARALQGSLVEFAREGRPAFEGLPEWPAYLSGEGNTIMAFGSQGAVVTTDRLKNRRCEYWQSGDYQDLV